LLASSVNQGQIYVVPDDNADMASSTLLRQSFYKATRVVVDVKRQHRRKSEHHVKDFLVRLLEEKRNSQDGIFARRVKPSK
jgi:hypothetical protein